MPEPSPKLEPRTCESLPEFAREWLQQWRRAAVELPKIRDAELRKLGSGTVPSDLMQLECGTEQPLNGLIKQQRWFMRQRLLETRNA